jgi:hypothetical protein
MDINILNKTMKKNKTIYRILTREWIYVAFSIVLFSAFIAKVCTGYAVSASLEPVFTFTLMLASVLYLNKLNKQAHKKA